MPVESKNRILSRHPYLHLSLSHAAIGTYPCHSRNHVMMVNRLIVVFADSGEERSSIRDATSGEVFPMTTGCWYLVPCHHPSDWDFSPQLQFVSLHFNLELFYGFDMFRNYPRCCSGTAAEWFAELRDLLWYHEGEIASLCRINEIIYHLCFTLLACQPEPVPAREQWQDYEPVFDFIRKFGDASVTVERLAELMKMRHNVFSRKFTRDIGIPPKDFLLNTLTRKASEMLLAPGASVKQTAERLKFSSEYYFSGFFKRRTGMSPREFQRNNGVK